MKTIIHLTHRQQEVLHGLAKGYTHAAIAQELSISEAAVDKHIQRLKVKFKDEPEWRQRELSSAVAWYQIGQRYERTTTPQDPHKVGLRFIVDGHMLREQHRWEEAITAFGEAESTLGTTSSQAARAACCIAQLHLELGDNEKAREEVNRAVKMYHTVIEGDAAIELNVARGWIEYDAGNLVEAKGSLETCIAIARESGTEFVVQDAHHFLGRVYCELGIQATQPKTAERWFTQAAAHFDTAAELHNRWESLGDVAYDLFRKAQLRRVQGQWRDARALRSRARELFGGNIVGRQIDLEEARLALRDNTETDKMLYKVEEALREWAELKYARGMSNALQILGDGHLNHTPEKALELYVAGWCVNPIDNDRRKLLASINTIAFEMDTGAWHKSVRQIEELVKTRRGPFVYLNNIVVDRSDAITSILSRLRGTPLSR